MRSLLVILFLSILWFQGPTSDPRIAGLTDGTVTQKTYKNEAIEATFRVKDGWTFDLIPAGTAVFAPDRAGDDPVNRCSRALFSNKQVHVADRDFGPRSVFFVFDPECFPGAPFPHSTKDRPAVSAFAKRVVHALGNTSYIPSTGADFGGFDAGGQAFITLTAEREMPVPQSNPAQERMTHVNTLLMLIESSGYWIVVAELVDDNARKVMQASTFDVSER